jgi:hypothetical protein
MIPNTIIGIEIQPVPTDPRALQLFHMNFPVTLPPVTTAADMTEDERKWCTSQILGQVNELIVNGTDPYAMKYSLYIASRIVDVAAVKESAREARAAKAEIQDAECYTDGNLWGVGDPKGNPPPNYIPGMHSSISYNVEEKGYRYPPGSDDYEGPYMSFTVLDSKGTNGPPKPYIGSDE